MVNSNLSSIDPYNLPRIDTGTVSASESKVVILKSTLLSSEYKMLGVVSHKTTNPWLAPKSIEWTTSSDGYIQVNMTVLNAASSTTSGTISGAILVCKK